MMARVGDLKSEFHFELTVWLSPTTSERAYDLILETLENRRGINDVKLVEK